MKSKRSVQLDIFENSGASDAFKRTMHLFLDEEICALFFRPCLMLIGLLCLVGMSSGCAVTQMQLVRLSGVGYEGLVEIEPVESKSRSRIRRRWRYQIPAPSEEVMSIISQYGLSNSYLADPLHATRELKVLAENPATSEGLYATSQLARLHAQWAEYSGEAEIAFEMNMIALESSSLYLFGLSGGKPPEVTGRDRDIRNTYNKALEGFLAGVVARGELPGGDSGKIQNLPAGYEIEIEINGRWRDANFSEVALSRDFEVGRFENQFRTDGRGWGVPLIAVRDRQSSADSNEMYYPEKLPIPMTAVFQLTSPAGQVDDPREQLNRNTESSLMRGKLILFDPLEETTVAVGQHRLELERDITTPLAYGLIDPFLNKELNATVSLFNPDLAPESYGLFMLEPFDPDKIPVIFVHGFWSSATTWIHMLNELRGDAEIQEKFQFWFYSYPTGKPFWESARELRSDLAQMVESLDPNHESICRDEAVMVGHSMGGLLSLMQTFDSGDEFWKLNSDYPLSGFQGDPETLASLEDAFYFRKNPSIDRVITIATPFGGSRYSNHATQWFGKKVISGTQEKAVDLEQLIESNQGKWKQDSLVGFTTSIESLHPQNPAIQVFNERLETSGVKVHNIAGQVEKKTIFPKPSPKFADDDGVVDIKDAFSSVAISKKLVPCEHNHVHQHPDTINEVRRLLRVHWEQRQQSSGSPPVNPVSSVSAGDGIGVQFQFRD
ncbi:MAG: esterase/lipase family protein [Mariniblastus sp.]